MTILIEVTNNLSKRAPLPESHETYRSEPCFLTLTVLERSWDGQGSRTAG